MYTTSHIIILSLFYFLLCHMVDSVEDHCAIYQNFAHIYGYDIRSINSQP